MKRSEIMKRSKFEKYHSQMILKHNLSNICIEEALSVAEYCSLTIVKMPENSVLALTIIDKSSKLFTVEIIEKFRQVFEKNRGKVKASAFVCPDEELRRMFLSAAFKACRNNLQFFATEEEAKQWLLHY